MICKLCKYEEAEQKNSHIIPRFFRSRISDKPYKLISVKSKEDTTQKQDIPKEDYILCISCEKKFNFPETEFANKVIKFIDNYSKYPDVFEILGFNDQQYLACKKISPISLKLFLYSIVWRCSISNLSEFKNFKLPENIEEELRVFLDRNLIVSLNSLITNAVTPNYHLVLIKSENRINQLLAAANFGFDAYIIFMADFALFFYTTELPTVKGHENFSNRQNEISKIVIGKSERWQELINAIVNPFLQVKVNEHCG